MSDLIDIKPGDFAVIERPYNRFAAVHAGKATAAQFKASGEWSSREHTYQRQAVVYAGPQDKAELLCARLTSSTALFEDEKRKAGERRDKRNEELIAAAQTGND